MSGNSRIPSSPPEAFLPLLGLSALLLGLGALSGHLFADASPEPVRAIGENAILGAFGDDREPEDGYPVLLSMEACETLLGYTKSRRFVYPELLHDEEQTIWADAGTPVEVIDASHPKFTGIRILEGENAGRFGWVWMDHVVREDQIRETQR